jgi:hypothetical protein
MTQAGAAIQAVAPATPLQASTIQPTAVVAGEAGRKHGLRSSAEKSPLTMKSAASTNTAAAIAGLKPWSKDWVFEGGANRNPDLRPLIGGDSSPLAEELKAARAALASEADSKDGTDTKAPVLPTEAGAAPPEAAAPAGVAAPLAGAAAAGAVAVPGAGAEEKAPPVPERVSKAAAKGGKHSARESAPGADGPSVTTRGDAAATAPTTSGAAAAGNTALLAGLLAGLGGDEEDGLEVVDKKSGERTSAVPAPYAGLSGGEFVRTLDAAREGGGEPGARARLRVIEGGPRELTGDEMASARTEGAQPRPRLIRSRGDEFLVAAPAAAGHNPMAGIAGPARVDESAGWKPLPPTVVAGHVIPGAMARDRLASASLHNLTNQVKSLGPTGGGEIRLRLKPDHLGELRVRVATDGHRVALQIQASDERAKRVLEDSMSYLKDSLATQQLQLSRVEVAVAGTGGLASGDLGRDSGSQQQQQYQSSQSQSGYQDLSNLLGQDSRRGGYSRQAEDGSQSWATSGRTVSGTSLAASSDPWRKSAVMSSGRLDVMA